MSYYLGVDIGTTTAKAVAFSKDGMILYQVAAGYGMLHPAPGRSEQNPDEIFDAVIHTITNVLQTLAGKPLFIAFSAAMHSIIAVNDKGNPLTPCIIWADNRAAAMADSLRNSEQGYRFYTATGVPLHAMSPLCKLLWFKEVEPAVFTTAFKFIGIKEYVFYRLCGQFIVDTSIASATGLLNLSTLSWDEEILAYACIEPNRLSTLVSVKHICYCDNRQPGLSILNDIPFVIGASDGTLATLGSAAHDKEALSVTIGTSGAVRRLVTAPQTDSAMRSFCYHLKDTDYVIGGATNNGAIVLQWLKESLLQTDDDFEALFLQAATIVPGSNGLLLLPYLFGERAPLWNTNAKGVWFGFDIHHTKAHFIRACMEGVMYSLYSIARIVTHEDTSQQVYVSGGFTKSNLWLQIAADVFSRDVVVSGDGESAAFGAVLVGAEAVGLKTNFERTVVSVHQPIPGHHEIYQNCFSRFERLYGLLKEEMNGDSLQE
jgi:gluconokinase